MCGSMADIQSATAEIRAGKKDRKKKKPQGKNIMSASTQGGHNNHQPNQIKSKLTQHNTDNEILKYLNYKAICILKFYLLYLMPETD